ncbi:hypothetical protein MTO96_013101 [Rhipicephalus appendiculatus]
MPRAELNYLRLTPALAERAPTTPCKLPAGRQSNARADPLTAAVRRCLHASPRRTNRPTRGCQLTDAPGDASLRHLSSQRVPSRQAVPEACHADASTIVSGSARTKPQGLNYGACNRSEASATAWLPGVVDYGPRSTASHPAHGKLRRGVSTDRKNTAADGPNQRALGGLGQN